MATPNTYAKRVTDAPRVDLLVKDFDNLLIDQGSRVRITPSILCPKRTSLPDSPADVNHDLNCTLCNGDQVIDVASQAYEDWVYIQGIKLSKSFAEQGVFDAKDALMTVRGEARISYWFKIEVIDFGSLYNEMVIRGQSGDFDRTRYEPKDPCDGSYFTLLGQDGTEFERGTDYELDGHGIKWLSANRPGAGELYSFLYPVLPTFRVLELMHENRYYYDSFKKSEKIPVQLPQQAHIRWDFMAKREGSDVPIP